MTLPIIGEEKTQPKYETITIFLNRACPRGCPQCGISDNSRNPLNVKQWIEIFTILKEEFQTKFFLFLGTEPLIFRQELVEMVEWFTANNIFYGFYSTSPEPMFTKYRQPLVDAGLKNWSSGIDILPWLGELDKATMKKIKESIMGLQWMAERGVQTHTQMTIHKQNLAHVVDTLIWCQQNIPGAQSTVNFIEWKKSEEFDFFSPKEEMLDHLWDGTPEEEAEIKKVMREIKALSRIHGYLIQTPDEYLDNAHRFYTTLDQHCGGVIGPSVDCDGSLRLCGYSTGNLTKQWLVRDLPGNVEKFLHSWHEDLAKCSGCHWIFPDMLRGDNVRILDPHSGFHEDRWNTTLSTFLKRREQI